MWHIALIVAAVLQGWGTTGQGWAAPAAREAQPRKTGQCGLAAATAPGERYSVQVNGADLGFWQKLSETSSTVTLSRAATASSQATRQVLQQWQPKTPETVAIAALDASGSPLARQTLLGATPAKWSVNAMDAGASQVSIETLELNFTSIRCA